MKWVIAVLLAASLCGCSGVVSNQPLGLAPLDLTDQADKWTGTWLSPYGPCAITVADATNGALAMTSTKPLRWWRWSNETDNLYLRIGGEWIFASLECADPTNTVYFWGKIANEDGMLLWWLPKPETFKPLVESGTLPGTVEKGYRKKKKNLSPPILGYTEAGEAIYQAPDGNGSQPETTDSTGIASATGAPVLEEDPSNYLVNLGDLEPKHYELICAATNGVMFDWERPYVMVKESGRADMGYLRSAQKRWMREQGK